MRKVSLMTIIDFSNTKSITELNLHDAEIHEINCNYYDKTVLVPVVLHHPHKNNIRASMLFEDVSSMKVELTEPWGAGHYIVEVTIKEMNTNLSSFNFEILLNSGDKIIVNTRKMIYHEQD
jgi:hypothetical protein